MFDLDTWQEIWHTITRNRLRSLLTAFGVFWGIFMLVILVGFGQGLERGVRGQLGKFSVNSAFLISSRTSMPYKGFQKGRWWEFKNADIDIMKQKFPYIAYATPYIFGRYGGENNVKHVSGEGTFNAIGFGPDIMQINPVEVIKGRYINDIDIIERRKVCVLGENAYSTLFPTGKNPVGENIEINGIYYTIVGHFETLAEGINIMGNAKDEIHIPYTTLQQVEKRGDRLDCIAIALDDNAVFEKKQDEVLGDIKQRHVIDPNDRMAIYTIDTAKQFDMVGNIFLGINALIWVVGMGTLVAGVVGVSNIMLISVRERTLEIGIRRALGAKPIQIITQIMSESLVLTTIAGVFGMFAGIAILVMAEAPVNSSGGKMTIVLQAIEFSTAVVALSVIIVCGLFAGILPALRALDIKAIDALRDE